MAAPKRSYSQFFYRQSADNTTDAICGFCFLTVASAESEADLHALESVHQCNQEEILVDRRLTPTWQGEQPYPVEHSDDLPRAWTTVLSRHL
jgi:hypothetical protein